VPGCIALLIFVASHTYATLHSAAVFHAKAQRCKESCITLCSLYSLQLCVNHLFKYILQYKSASRWNIRDQERNKSL